MITERQIAALSKQYGLLADLSLETESFRIFAHGKVLPRLREGRWQGASRLLGRADIRAVPDAEAGR